MTKEEAKKLLEDNHICPKHGINMVYNPGLDDEFLIKRNYVCSSCETEKYVEKVQKIEEAKRVLGIVK